MKTMFTTTSITVVLAPMLKCGQLEIVQDLTITLARCQGVWNVFFKIK
jgi:hypothetical protein